MPVNVSSPFAFASVAGIENDDDATNNNGHHAPLPLPPDDPIMERMASGAFRSLCEHLRLRSDEVQNMDLMTVGGFCRNCLAKWMVLEARRLKQSCLEEPTNVAPIFAGNDDDEFNRILVVAASNALNSFGYDEAAREVYGTTYPKWKERHQRKATEEQLRLYKESVNLHAEHDVEMLKKSFCTSAAANYPSKRALVRLQAGAFLSLCRHLRDRSDQVANMELMTISGFCRNCLAKWLVVEARKISDRARTGEEMASNSPEQRQATIQSLDLFGYDEAAQYVYGCTYPEWKMLHQKKATDGQMKRYDGSKHLHAKHDKDLLATRSSNGVAVVVSCPPSGQSAKAQICAKEPTQQPNSLLSDVCCQDVEETSAMPAAGVVPQFPSASRRVPIPPKVHLGLKVGILTVSDRAASNAYETGDLSGPAVETALTGLVNQINASHADRSVAIDLVERAIVPDEVRDIKGAILRWSDRTTTKTADSAVEEEEGTRACDLILTTGGTGFAPRDVTPEATLSAVDRECGGLMSWASAELTGEQPLATLSRAAAGMRGGTLVVNLPGNPAGAAQVTRLLFPLLLHAIVDLGGGRL